MANKPIEERREKALAFLTAHPTLNPNEEWVFTYNNYRKLLLVIAIREYMLDVAEKLIDMGADVNKKVSQLKKTVLMNSIGGSYSYTKMPDGYADEDGVKFLLAHGADPNITDKYGDTMLRQLTAGHYKNIRVIEALIASGADINIKNLMGSAPIHGATAEVTKLLIANGADVNTKSNNGSTPIHEACINAYINLATVLLENGANIEAPFIGKTPLLIALDRYQAGSRVNIKFVRLLLKYGANINAKDSRGRGVDYYINLIEREGVPEDYNGDYEINPKRKAFADQLRSLIKSAKQYPEKLGSIYAQHAFNEATNKTYGAPFGTFSIPIKNKIGNYLGHNKN
jgi:ankyrin repeat protein